MDVELLDLDGAPIGVPIISFTVGHAPASDGTSTIGLPLDLGGGHYSVIVTAGTDPGVDRFRITADAGERPVLLMPDPKLPVGVPQEVTDLRWTSAVSLEWSAAAGATSYHVYRGALADLNCDDFGECRDDLDPDPTDLVLVDPIGPLTGSGFFYLVTSEDAGGNESILGVSSCGIRANPDPCP
jgi:hypothetical protein